MRSVSIGPTFFDTINEQKTVDETFNEAAKAASSNILTEEGLDCFFKTVVEKKTIMRESWKNNFVVRNQRQNIEIQERKDLQFVHLILKAENARSAGHRVDLQNVILHEIDHVF